MAALSPVGIGRLSDCGTLIPVNNWIGFLILSLGSEALCTVLMAALSLMGMGDTITLWDADTGELRRTLEGHEDGVTSVAFSPIDSTIASVSSDNTARLWDVDTGNLLHTITEHRAGYSKDTTSVSFRPDGGTIASGSSDTVRVWDIASGNFLHTLTGAYGED